MSQTRTSSERSDDIPLIIYWLRELKLPELLDEALPSPHGNRQGLSYGQLSVVLLNYIITQSDHRLCAVEDWVKQHHQTKLLENESQSSNKVVDNIVDRIL